ncbi:TolC family outer membrane protein [Thiofilum flexile]|uniref:TolC family outer membrane protein n=1 Tax=Thiofilum flexile TaxID=125627 RepID=UPI0003A736E1|nr:TolC family outer membrane protein [Thiofilum flexile]
MKKLTLSAWMCVALGSVSLSAQAENLLQVYQQAKTFDAQLKAQETGYLATLENRVQAKASKKPQITLSGSSGYSRSDIFYDASVLSDTAHNNTFSTSYTLSLTKSLYNKTIEATIAQADVGIAQAYASLENQRQSLLLNVARRYFNFLLAQDTVDYAASQKQSTERQLKQTKAFFEAGRSPITDVREAQAKYDLTVSQEVSAQQQLLVAREALRVVTGKNYKTLNAPQPNIKLVMPQPNNVDTWITASVKNNKTLLVSQKAIEVARASIEVARAAKKPVVSLYANHTGSMSSGSSALDPISTGFSAGVQASIPLYTGGETASKVRQAQLLFKQAQQNYQYQARLVEEEVRSAFLSVQSSIAQANANRQSLLSAETAARATQVGFQVGTRTAVDMVAALTATFSARRDYASARYNYLLNMVNLKMSSGVLAEQDLAQLSRLLTQSPSLQRAALDRQTKELLKPVDLDLLGAGRNTATPRSNTPAPRDSLSLPAAPALTPLPTIELPPLPSLSTPSVPLSGSVVIR